MGKLSDNFLLIAVNSYSHYFLLYLMYCDHLPVSKPPPALEKSKLILLRLHFCILT